MHFHIIYYQNAQNESNSNFLFKTWQISHFQTIITNPNGTKWTLWLLSLLPLMKLWKAIMNFILTLSLFLSKNKRTFNFPYSSHNSKGESQEVANKELWWELCKFVCENYVSGLSEVMRFGPFSYLSSESEGKNYWPFLPLHWHMFSFHVSLSLSFLSFFLPCYIFLHGSIRVARKSPIQRRIQNFKIKGLCFHKFSSFSGSDYGLFE